MTKHLEVIALLYIYILYKIDFDKILENGLVISIKRKESFIVTSQRVLIKNEHIT